jgi:DNA invertase Pin-like site-specific DNA recombinase
MAITHPSGSWLSEYLKAQFRPSGRSRLLGILSSDANCGGLADQRIGGRASSRRRDNLRREGRRYSRTGGCPLAIQNKVNTQQDSRLTANFIGDIPQESSQPGGRLFAEGVRTVNDLMRNGSPGSPHIELSTFTLHQECSLFSTTYLIYKRLKPLGGSMKKPLQPNQQQPIRTTVGCYARFSDEDLQTKGSIDSQVHECKVAATGNGWTFDSALIFSDAGISGETLETRTGLTSLLKLVESGKAPFSGIIIDDTNRLGRRVSDVLRVCEIFKFHDIFLYFVNRQLGSRDPRFERLIIDYSNEDQQFLPKRRHTVRRGQKDRARKGLTPGGFRYAYTTELVPDPTFTRAAHTSRWTLFFPVQVRPRLRIG